MTAIAKSPEQLNAEAAAKRLKREVALASAQRFWQKVDRRGVDECWVWLGALSHRGYGHISFPAQTVGLVVRKGKRSIPMLAHRVAYTMEHGSIPEDLLVLHRCDNRRCVNPAHLYVGTAWDNTHDMMSRGRGWWQKQP